MTFHIPGPAILFAPVNRPELIPKAAARADMVILDLEDGAGTIDRDEAYATITGANLDPDRTFIRIVGPQDPNHASDIAFVRGTEYTNVIIPKIGPTVPPGLEGYHLVPIIETPAALLNIATIATHPDVVGLYWGADDLTIALGGMYSRQRPDELAPGRYRETMWFARTQTLLHAAAAGKFAMDAVYQDFSDEEGLYLEALDSARMGFRLFPCIHPRQVPVVRRAFQPSGQQVEWARRIAREADRHPGAFQLDGEMVDAPLIALARDLLARAGDS